MRAIRNGWLKAPEDTAPNQNYPLWDTTSEARVRRGTQINAPKISLPGHAESYNPPQEYLLDDDEKAKMLAQDSEDRKYNFVPAKFACSSTPPPHGAGIRR